MKKFYWLMVISLFVFSPVGSVNASYVNICDLGIVFSPDSTSKTDPNSINAITDVAVSQWGSVFIGAKNDSVVWPEETVQPVGIYGIGVPLASLGTTPGSYTIKFDGHFRSYDSTGFDDFLAVVTQGNYLWSGGNWIGGYDWGGTDEPEAIAQCDFSPAIPMATIFVNPATNYYLNIVLQTTYDENLPSWGRFSDVCVEYNQCNPVPEPGTLMLLGSGLVGIIAIRRKKQG